MQNFSKCMAGTELNDCMYMVGHDHDTYPLEPMFCFQPIKCIKDN